MNNLFQQKQRELVMAASKVEELNRQLELLKNGKMDNFHDNQSSVAELDRLYKELQVWSNKGKFKSKHITCLKLAQFLICVCAGWSAEEQAQPGSKLKAPAPERKSEQAQPGSGCYGQTDQWAPRPAVEKEGSPAAERELARKYYCTKTTTNK